ncbi:gamma-glutamylcyclotransferase [Stenotrophomonas mori]|uniref:Gamma-glutamylcyclotransferase n=1 Tax=Stenotrophomonas mori TaxID=2871096 RepID=A0ABT0SIP3_9GAMM|nr:gamma-glutamylcyclotransferase [Stenotrophomonas mori]MCL7715132.1 gamma-glutamylcyclotransferase [Stenotrophomonas mori]
MGVVPIPRRSIRFHNKSTDHSGNCDLIDSNPEAIAYGALYEFNLADKPGLDAAEGLGHGYRQATVAFPFNNVTYRAFVYVASVSHIDKSLNPYHWYKQLILCGARYHRFPDEYIAELESVPSITDPDTGRSAKNGALLARMAEF